MGRVLFSVVGHGIIIFVLDDKSGICRGEYYGFKPGLFAFCFRAAVRVK